MKKTPKHLTLWFAGVSTLMMAFSANAIGFGAGVELGGFAGGAGITQGIEPSLYGGGGALVLSLELYDEGLLRVQTLARLEGNGFGIGSSAGAGAGGAGGAEGLLRLGFDLPVVEPFLELGGGAAVAAGGGTTNLTDVSGATGDAVSGTMWVPAGYLGVGLTMALPLLPYFELRVGSHVGSLTALDPPAPIPLSGIEALSARGEVWLGVGYRI